MSETVSKITRVRTIIAITLAFSFSLNRAEPAEEKHETLTFRFEIDICFGFLFDQSIIDGALFYRSPGCE